MNNIPKSEKRIKMVMYKIDRRGRGPRGGAIIVF